MDSKNYSEDKFEDLSHYELIRIKNIIHRNNALKNCGLSFSEINFTLEEVETELKFRNDTINEDQDKTESCKPTPLSNENELK